MNRKTKKGQSGIRSGKLFQCLAVVMALSLSGAPVSAAAEVKEEIIYTADGLEDYMAESAKRKSEPVQTNSDSDWPQGPAVSAAGAIVMDADSGAVLYGKNIYKHLYPASITKVMTGLLAYENLKLTDTVKFSENAVFGIEQGSSNIGIDVGESITVDEALYGLMVASANEVAIALGERVSGTKEGFANLMNERAAQLGCKNTSFVTLNGLHDKNHYTCVYDMALIAREAFRHPDFIHYMSQANYHFEASENQPDDFWLGNTNDFLTGAIPCDDVIGGKTGYTDEARETLVSFAERDGKRLICVIMKDEPPYQYYDTIDLLNYAFDNFKKINITEQENRFTLQSGDFLSFGTDIFGSAAPCYYIPENTTMLIPKDLSFEDLTAEIVPLPSESSRDEADLPQETEGNTAGVTDTGGSEGNAAGVTDAGGPEDIGTGGADEIKEAEIRSSGIPAAAQAPTAGKAGKDTAKGAAKDAGNGKAQDADDAKKAGKDTAQDASKDAGNGKAQDADTAKKAGKDTTKDAAKDAGNGKAQNADDAKNDAKDTAQDAAKDTGNGTAEDSAAGADAPSTENSADTSSKKNKSSSKSGDTEDFAPAAPTGTESPDASAFTEDGKRILGTIYYKYHAYNLGSAQVLFDPGSTAAAAASPSDVELPGESSLAAGNDPAPAEVHGIRSLFFGIVHTGAHGSIYLNILFLIPLVLAAAFLLCIIFFIFGFFAERKRRRQRKNRRAARAGQRSSFPEEEAYRQTRPSGQRRGNTNRQPTDAGDRGQEKNRKRTTQQNNRRTKRNNPE
ncbi:MAG: hypothetical protein Q4D81_02140 [Eubacteriales bacterium]|nr:hypothetical protein [Eubacteriales bacterium]